MPESEKIDFITASSALLKVIRGDDSRRYLIIIVNAIMESKQHEKDNFIRAIDLQAACVSPDKIPYSSVFYRLLKRLVDAKIIYPVELSDTESTKGRKAKYYYIPDGYSPLMLETREVILDRALFLERRLRDCEEIARINELKFKESCKVLRGHGIKNPEEMIDDLIFD